MLRFLFIVLAVLIAIALGTSLLWACLFIWLVKAIFMGKSAAKRCG